MGTDLTEKRRDKVRQLAKENAQCCNCTTKLPNHVVMQFGIFVCLLCASAHRQLSHQGVKTISSSDFSKEDYEFLKSRGNELIRKQYGLNDSHRLDKSQFKSDKDFVNSVRDFIHSVFDKKKFAKDANVMKDSFNSVSGTESKKVEISFSVSNQGEKLVPSSRRRALSVAKSNEDKQSISSTTLANTTNINTNTGNLFDEILKFDNEIPQTAQNIDQLNSKQQNTQSQLPNARKDLLSQLDDIFSSPSQSYDYSNLQQGIQLNPFNTNTHTDPNSIQYSNLYGNSYGQQISEYSNPFIQQNQSQNVYYGISQPQQFHQVQQPSYLFPSQTGQYTYGATTIQNEVYPQKSVSNPFSDNSISQNPFEMEISTNYKASPVSNISKPTSNGQQNHDAFSDLLSSFQNLSTTQVKNQSNQQVNLQKGNQNLDWNSHNSSKTLQNAPQSTISQSIHSIPQSTVSQSIDPFSQSDDPFGFSDNSFSVSTTSINSKSKESLKQEAISSSVANAHSFETTWRNNNVLSSDNVREGNFQFSLKPDSSFKQNVGWRNK